VQDQAQAQDQDQDQDQTPVYNPLQLPLEEKGESKEQDLLGCLKKRESEAPLSLGVSWILRCFFSSQQRLGFRL